jgi:hypothetical protein
LSIEIWRVRSGIRLQFFAAWQINRQDSEPLSTTKIDLTAEARKKFIDANNKARAHFHLFTNGANYSAAMLNIALTQQWLRFAHGGIVRHLLQCLGVFSRKTSKVAIFVNLR